MTPRAGLMLVTAATALALCACGPAVVTPAAAPAAPPSTTVPSCAPAASRDDTGSPLPAEYAEAASRVAEAACRHDWTALTALMDDRFTDDTYRSAAPSTIVAGWRAVDPSGRQLDELAAVLARPPVLDQGGLTFSAQGVSATFARSPLSRPWTGYVHDAGEPATTRSGGTGTTGSGSGSPSGGGCPSSSTLTSAWNAAPSDGSSRATAARHILCDGAWAGAQIEGSDGNAYSGLFRRTGSGWTRADLGTECPSGRVPASLSVVCTSN